MRLAYWMYEGTAHHGVGRIANSLRGVHAVFHAPQGDDYVNPIFTMLERTPDFPQMTTSVVDGRDLAMGTIRLPDTLKQVEAKLHPELIVVCASCSTILLQENLQMICDNTDVEAEVVVYDANPYRMQEIVAAESLFTFLVKRYAESQPLTNEPTVNLIGPASLGFHNRQDLIALRRTMATLGVKINAIAPLGASLDDLRQLPRAWVNIAPYRELGKGAAAYLQEEFGTPAITEAPMGVQPTLRWLKNLLQALNTVGATQGHAPLEMPPMRNFSLDGLSAPSGVPWFARTADMESFSSKRAFVFGDATHTVGMVKFLRDELAMQIVGAGTYLKREADWVRQELDGYLPDELLVTDHFQDVSKRIDELMPDLVCGTQMERHTARKFQVPCMVIAPPTHIENHLLSYTPMLGFEGSNYLADKVYTTAKLGLEKHLIDMFGDAGLDYEDDNAPHMAPPTRADAPATNGNGHAAQGNGHASNAASAAAESVAEAVTESPEPEELTTDDVAWSADGEKMLGKVPFFVRGRVRRNTEQWAAENGHRTITADVLQMARESLGG
jgi:light-independent protochlorophyllide reductase subunit B